MKLMRPTTNRSLSPAKRGSLWDPFGEEFFSSFDDVFKDTAPMLESMKGFAPALNISEDEKGYHFDADLPGVKKEDIDISFKDDNLIIKGEKKSFNEEKKDEYHRVERSHGSFYRSVSLPRDADKENISAELKDGVLSVNIGKSAKSLDSKKITIQ